MAGKDALDDLTQETFVRIWKGLPNFGLRSSIQTWIYRITINTATDHLRRNKSMMGLNEEISQKTVSQDGQPLSYTELVETALTTLDEDLRPIIILFYFEEMSIRDIAITLKLPEGTVKSRMHLAKKRMKVFFSAKGISF